MAYFKVTFNSFRRSYSHGEIEDIDLSDDYYVEADTQVEAITIADKIHLGIHSSVYYVDSDVKEITKEELIASKQKCFTKNDI